jgi:tetratricopeptide (TPR) repeat protein
VFFNNQAFAQIKLKQYDEAIESYNRALNICPTHHIYLKNRANLYMEKKKVKEALHDISKAIQLEPKHEYYFLKGKW